MDLIFIVVGMSLGGFGGWMIAQAIPGISVELQILISLLGSFVGAAGGYFLAWIYKLPGNTAAKPPVRQFQPQMVGSCCVNCGERIMLISDGQICVDCGRVFCTQCEANMPCSACRKVIATKEPVDECLDALTSAGSVAVDSLAMATTQQDSAAIPTADDANLDRPIAIVVRQCQHCGVGVIPKHDGRCPACQHSM